MRSIPSARRRLATGAGLALVTTGLAPVLLTGTAVAAPDGSNLVISEVYGGGGNSGAPFTHDFIELYNPTDAPISVDGLSVQYRSSSGGGTGFTNLSGSVPANRHYLIQQAKGAGGTVPLPTPDATGELAMSGSAGSVALVRGTGTVAPTAANTVDLVGYGAAALSETAPTPALSNTTAATRDAARRDTDNNSVDFVVAPPAPQNASDGSSEEPPPTAPAPVEKTIAQIQGTGSATPIAADQVVITKGVVTAAYPTGGFNGFYLQTGGEDTTPGASDGIFVYEPGFAGISVGDSLRVQGLVKEFNGLTQIEADSVTEIDALPAVVPNTTLPGTDCALPGTECLTGAALEAAREEFEGEAFLPAGPTTVTDAYDFGVTSSSFFGEIGLAARSAQPLVTPTEVVDAQDTAGIAARTAYNTAHLVVLDDGSSVNYWNTAGTAAGQDQPVPWLTADHTVRVGASVTFDAPVILDYRFGWKLQPQRQVVGVPTGLITFEQDRPAAPAPVGGDLKLATFNVLNYFTTLGVDVPGCTAYVDRDGDPVATNRCSGSNGPRGAWEPEDFERQQAKIVKAINTMDADIVSLEELENSATVDGHDRDEAVAALVKALNAAAGSTRWAYVPSPTQVPANEDVIRNGFIYDPSTVALVGESQIHDAPAFDNARDPLAQVFKPKGGGAGTEFAVIVNHFKSKGSGVDDGTGQGNANPDRVAQAKSLTAFASSFSAARGTDKVFLTGDFNAYSMEDPVQEIEAAGYVSLESTDDPHEETYSYAGTSGSLDHVFANGPARAMVTGVDVWEINANESMYYQYSRHNYIGTLLYRPDVYAASDHNPEIVGIKVAGKVATDVEVSVTPKVVVVNRTRPMVHVKVSRADGRKVTDGTVEVREGDQVLASATVTNGVVNLRLPRFDETGEHLLSVRYVGGSSATVEETTTVTVRKAASDIRRAEVTDAVVGKVATLLLKVRDGDAGPATGKVKVKVRGTWKKATLKKGRATVQLGRFAKAGKHRVVVKYLGDASTKRHKEVLTIRIR